MPKINTNKLTLFYSKKGKNLVCRYPKKSDMGLIFHHFGNVLRWGGINGKDKGWLNFEDFNIVDELERRGYDITTLKFSIELKEIKYS